MRFAARSEALILSLTSLDIRDTLLLCRAPFPRVHGRNLYEETQEIADTRKYKIRVLYQNIAFSTCLGIFRDPSLFEEWQSRILQLVLATNNF